MSKFLEKHIFVITFTLSMLMFIPSFFDFSEDECSKPEERILYIERRTACPQINHNSEEIIYFSFFICFFYTALFFLLKRLKINHFFDKNLFAGTILFLSAPISLESSFSNTKFVSYYTILLLFISLFFLFLSIKNNYQHYKIWRKRVIYFVFLGLHGFIACMFVGFYGMYRCVGGCL